MTSPRTPTAAELLPIRRLLVANRGEIALRVLRTASRLGVETVAVYADQDRAAPFVRAADVQVPLFGTRAEETYLRIDKIIAALGSSGADAVHPGYGFLAEDHRFARAVREAGAVFVGPSPDVLQLTGDKLAARDLAHSVGVPVLPAHRGDVASFREAARRLGLPVLIKAAGGGGGRGMRRVEDLEAIETLAESASREAEAYFGNGEVYLEKEVLRARHVEFQVLADRHGSAVELGERECSMQRRHQKILEESPSCALDDGLRSDMAAAALRIVHAAKYDNAGTVEFLVAVDPSGAAAAFYFLEVNARLQVEHPVTEARTGLDLVAWQLRLACGHPLASALGTRRSGHAIECRVCAESPPSFLPAAGRLAVFRPPRGPAVRFDEGYEEGDLVPAEFDSLIGKLVVYGEDRETALRSLEMALESTVVLGVDTNVGFLLDAVRHERFRSGQYTTRFVSDDMAHWQPEQPTADVLRVLAAFQARAQGAVPTKTACGPWQVLGKHEIPSAQGASDGKRP